MPFYLVMKVVFEEYSGCFSINLTPESVEEIMDLTRFGMLSTKELRHVSVRIPARARPPAPQKWPDANIVIGRNKRDVDTVPKIR